jgi:hypothetical protein
MNVLNLILTIVVTINILFLQPNSKYPIPNSKSKNYLDFGSMYNYLLQNMKTNFI